MNSQNGIGLYNSVAGTDFEEEDDDEDSGSGENFVPL